MMDIGEHVGELREQVKATRQERKLYVEALQREIARILAEKNDIIERHAKLEAEHADALRALKAERERAGKMAEQIRAQGQWAPIGLRDALTQWEASAALAAQEGRHD